MTQPSSPIRQSTELRSILQKKFSRDGRSADNPVLIIVSDGGPHHRITYATVKVAMLVLFRALELDMLVCVRTCPYQSWTNVAERVMSTLNFALMNVSLCRSALPTVYETPMKSKTLTEVRELIVQKPVYKALLRDAM